MDNKPGPAQTASCRDTAVLYPVGADRVSDLAAAVTRIGADPRALRYVQPKRRTLNVFIPCADYRAASFIKQEMLSRGGDAVVARGVIDGSARESSVLIMGTDGQISRLLHKMESMDCWGLRALRESLASVVKNIQINSWDVPLPSGRTLHLGGGTRIMGILNVTPDSFHAESRIRDQSGLLKRAAAMLKDGADILDVGAESTRPGSERISGEEELSRLLPALRTLRREFPNAVISVDTYRGSTALAAADEGADIINDVTGFGHDPDMLKCAAQSGPAYILSHIKGELGGIASPLPSSDIMREIHTELSAKLNAASEAGLSSERIIIDPGLGFGKTAEEDCVILKEISSLRALGRPILIGHSRKRFTGKDLTATTAVSALMDGQAEILRVHDAAENRRAMMMSRAIREANIWHG